MGAPRRALALSPRGRTARVRRGLSSAAARPHRLPSTASRVRPVRILHLVANWKWTGPAEPALNVAWRQSLQHDVLFLSGAAPTGQESRILTHVRELDVATRDGFQLGKHARLRRNRQDSRRLAELIADWRPQIVHCHLDNDHRIASVAVARAGTVRLVRTAYDADGLPDSLRVRRVAQRALDGLIVTSQHGWDATLASYGGSARTVSMGGRSCPMALIEGGIDLERFDPGRFDRAATRRRLGLSPQHVAIGIVARVQSHRRFEILIDAHARAAAQHPELRLVVIGRGTHIRPLLLDPVAARGLSDSVISTGYLDGETYPATLGALDASLFLVPGSDGTCRALREQMAMGLASLVTARPPLPDIVEEGLSGLIVEESVDGLADGLSRLCAEHGLRERLRAGAADAARRRFDLRRQAAAVTAFYEDVLAR